MSFTLEQFQADLLSLNVRKEQALTQIHQIIGAISVVEQIISRWPNPIIGDENLPTMDNVPVEGAQE